MTFILDRRGPWTADEFVGGQAVGEIQGQLTPDQGLSSLTKQGSSDRRRRPWLRDSSGPRLVGVQ
jgi:hypothetical protein